MNETNQVPQSSPEITYQVMPKAGRTVQMPQASPTPSSGNGSGAKWVYIVIGIIVLGGLGYLAYYFLGSGGKQEVNNTPTTKLSQTFLLNNFAKSVCDDATMCGDDADPDVDGLSNYMEFVQGTKATLSDSDSDGLADGDEVNIYGTNPNNKYTDTRAIAQENDYNDGSSIKNGYDPLTRGEKYTETSLAQITAKIAQYQLHEPTTTTLGLNPDGSVASPATQ